MPRAGLFSSMFRRISSWPAKPVLQEILAIRDQIVSVAERVAEHVASESSRRAESAAALHAAVAEVDRYFRGEFDTVHRAHGFLDKRLELLHADQVRYHSEVVVHSEILREVARTIAAEPAAQPQPDRYIPPCEQDVGRSYADPDSAPLPRIRCSPANPLPWTTEPTNIHITTEAGDFETVIYHPHLCFVKLVKQYSFHTVLDIGCGDGHETLAFRHLGKKVYTVNADSNPTFEVDFFGDYMDVQFDEPFDCIWISHVLEHVRNPGAFLDKMFHDLKDGGVLAISVPYNEFNSGPNTFTMGHHNRYNALLLLYALVSAGFDCRSENVALKIYNRQISLILTKKSNDLPRAKTMAPWVDVKRFFPIELADYGGNLEEANINWEGWV